MTQNGPGPPVARRASPCSGSEGEAAVGWVLGRLTWGHSRPMGPGREPGWAKELGIATRRPQEPSPGAVGPPRCPLIHRGLVWRAGRTTLVEQEAWGYTGQ